MQYKPYSLSNVRSLPQIAQLAEKRIPGIEIVGFVLPSRAKTLTG